MEVKKKILFLAVNPKDTERLRIDKEVGLIQERLERGSTRNGYTLFYKPYVNAKDISLYLDQNRPAIFHFSGHGKNDGIYLEGDSGVSKLITIEELLNLFKVRSNMITCAIFNSCFSELLAERVSEYIPYVIGTSSKIGDQAAIEFSKAFYGAIATGDNVEEAFEKGKAEIGLLGLQGTLEKDIPVLYRKRELNLESFKIEGVLIAHSNVDIKVNPCVESMIRRILLRLESRLRPNKYRPITVQIIFLTKNCLDSKKYCEALNLIAHKEKQNPRKTFIVEVEKVNVESLPEILKSVPRYSFWSFDEIEQGSRSFDLSEEREIEIDFYRYLADLANDVINVWEEKSKDVKATVYLARVPDTLLKERDTIMRYLKESNVQVLPHNNTLPEISYDAEITNDLKKCSQFIQILDEQYSNSFPFNQYTHAIKSGVDTLLWQPKDTSDFKSIHPKQKKLLQNAVLATPTEFKKHINEILFPESEKDMVDEVNLGSRKPKGMIFINTGKEDTPAAIKIGKILHKQGYGYALIRYTEEPAIIRKRRERHITKCDFMLMLQGQTPAEFIEELLEELEDLIKLKREKNNPLRTFLCQKNTADELFYIPSNLPLVKCDSFKSNCLNAFVKQVVK